MQKKWLNKQNNTKVIVFFSGWGMDESAVSNLQFGDFDVLCLFDYKFDYKFDYRFNCGCAKEIPAAVPLTTTQTLPAQTPPLQAPATAQPLPALPTPAQSAPAQPAVDHPPVPPVPLTSNLPASLAPAPPALPASNLPASEFFELEGYFEQYLVAWSMGVMVSNIFDFSNFKKRIAIAGTDKMIDDNFGIPRRIYDLTIKNFSEKSAEKFISNMTNGKYEIKTSRTMQDLKNELIALKNLNISPKTVWDRVIIPKEDKIVPSKNQIAYWGIRNVMVEYVECPHYVFSNFKKWEDIIGAQDQVR